MLSDRLTGRRTVFIERSDATGIRDLEERLADGVTGAAQTGDLTLRSCLLRAGRRTCES